jgi:hypothetical protein
MGAPYGAPFFENKEKESRFKKGGFGPGFAVPYYYL